MSERFPIATHHKKRLYVPEKRMYQLWTPRYNQGVGTLYLIHIEMPMGKFSNIPPISMMEVTLSSTRGPHYYFASFDTTVQRAGGLRRQQPIPLADL